MLGLLIVVLVTAASVQDSDAGQEVLIDVEGKTQRLEKVYADQGYRSLLVEWIARWQRCILEIVTRPLEQRGFRVLPERWIGERFFAWISNYRRLSTDYERTIASNSGMIYLVSIRLMMRKLAQLRQMSHS